MTPGQHELRDLAWPDVPKRAMVLVPVGSVEQHGPHLPMDTDTVLAASVATGVAAAVAFQLQEEVLVAPAVSYGSSGEHQSFAGTVSVGSSALRSLVVELVRSLSTWAGRIIFVNAHGGNIAALAAAVRQLTAEQHNVAWLPCIVEGGDLHAGRTETSLMLHLRPEAVRLERSTAGEMRSITEILPELKSGGVEAVSPSGVLGDPAGASAAEGLWLLELMVKDAAGRILSEDPDKNGMLAARRQPANLQALR